MWLSVPAQAETVLVLGDSISAAYGMETAQGWVALLEQRLEQQGYALRVVNASVSGETTSGGRSRLPGLLERHQPALLILELGGNDGLRGVPLEAIKRNLEALISQARQAGASVLLLGMRIPPNYGPVYADGFFALYADLSERLGTALVPFLLDGVGTDPELMQPDGIHPTASAQPALLDQVWPVLEPVLAQLQAVGAVK